MTQQGPTERRLARLRADYEAAKAKLAEVGFTCEGSLVERYTSCNNPNCRCADPAQRHGPYWQLSWKEGGKTVSKLLSADDAALYQEWIANRRRLEAALEQMRDLSRQAGEQVLASHGRPFHGSPAPPSPSFSQLERPPSSRKPGDMVISPGLPPSQKPIPPQKTRKPRISSGFPLDSE